MVRLTHRRHQTYQLKHSLTMKFTTPTISLFVVIQGVLATPTPAASDELVSRQNGGPVNCQTCNPLPEVNRCHPTTSCISIWGHNNSATPYPYYCACRAGYKGTYVGADPTAQWRLSWESQEGRVFVRPGVECNDLCNNWEQGLNGCREVPLYPQCL